MRGNLSSSLHAFLHGGDYNPDQWLDRPDVLRQDIELMKEAGVNCVSLGIFSWARLEPEEGTYNFDWLAERIQTLYENGIWTILATPSGAKPMWMAYRYPEILRVQENGQRDEMGKRHNHCCSSPVYREKTYAIDRKLAERFGRHPGVIAWHISNEYGGACWCDQCKAAFREYLKRKYATLEELNHEYWTDFWSHRYDCWEHVMPPMPHGETETHGLTLDWKRFVSQNTADFCAMEKKAIRDGGSELPVTANFMGFYDGLNYRDFENVLDFTCWDNYPEWHKEPEELETAVRTACTHDLTRCFDRERKPFLLMESTPGCTNWQPVSRIKKPGMHMLSSLQAVAHGSDSVQYFQWRKGRGGSEKFHGAVVDHNAEDRTRIFDEVAAVGSRLKEIRDIAGSLVRPEVAIIRDTENKWAIDGSRGPRNLGMHYDETVIDHYAVFWKRGIPVDVIDSTCSLEPYRLVVAPMLYMQRKDTAQKLSEFVGKGGTLVGTYQSGLVNENDLCFEGRVPHGLTDVFGLWREEIDGLWDGQENSTCWEGKEYRITELCERVHPLTAEVLSTYGSDFYAGEPVVLRNRFGKGIAWYLAARSSELLPDLYQRVLTETGIRPVLRAELPRGVSAHLRSSGETDYIFLLNWNREPVRVKPRESLTDPTAGEITGSLSLDPFEVRILTRPRTKADPPEE